MIGRPAGRIAPVLFVAAFAWLPATTALARPAAEATAPHSLALTVTRAPDDANRYQLDWKTAARARIFASTSAADPAATGKVVDAATGQPATVAGLDPAYRWYFEIRTPDGASAIAATREFQLEGARNVRDMGGFVTRDGSTTAWGKVFRSADLNKLTPAAERKLAAADVKTVVSFLSPGEIKRWGSDRLPAGTRLVHAPIPDPFTAATTPEFQDALIHGDAAVVQARLGNGQARQIGDEGFVKQLRNPQDMAAYATVLKAIANGNHALLYHCSAGKDRTGMMSALLLGLLGVPDPAIVEDFVASNTYNHAFIQQGYAFFAGKGIPRELVQPLLEQRASEIQPVLDAVRNEYGGWDRFARDVLKLDAATLARLRDRMLVRKPS